MYCELTLSNDFIGSEIISDCMVSIPKDCSFKNKIFKCVCILMCSLVIKPFSRGFIKSEIDSKVFYPFVS